MTYDTYKIKLAEEAGLTVCIKPDGTIDYDSDGEPQFIGKESEWNEFMRLIETE